MSKRQIILGNWNEKHIECAFVNKKLSHLDNKKVSQL